MPLLVASVNLVILRFLDIIKPENFIHSSSQEEVILVSDKIIQWNEHQLNLHFSCKLSSLEFRFLNLSSGTAYLELLARLPLWCWYFFQAPVIWAEYLI